MKSLKLHDTIWADGYKSKVTKITDDGVVGVVGLVLDEGLITEFYYECLLDEIRYYSFYDIEHDIINGYWISSMCEQVFSPTVKRKLKVYEVQDNVYLYNSLEELKEIYELLGEPHIAETYAKSNIDTLIDSLQYGLVYYWEDYDSERNYTYRYIKVIEGATFSEDEI